MLAEDVNLICVLEIGANHRDLDEAIAAASRIAGAVVLSVPVGRANVMQFSSACANVAAVREPDPLGDALATLCGERDLVWVLTLGTDDRFPANDGEALVRFTLSEALPGCTYGLHVCHMTADGSGYVDGSDPRFCLTAWEREPSASGGFRETPTLARVATTFRLQRWRDEVVDPGLIRPWRARSAGDPALQPPRPQSKPRGPVEVHVSAKPVIRIEPTKPPTRPTPFDQIVRHSAAQLKMPEEQRTLLPEGITHRHASVTSSYHMFAPPMAQNIAVVSRLLASIQIEPGVVFSLDRAIGPITEERGFTEGRVIAGGRVTSDIGGGLCAVSTLLFRAALLAGFPFIRWSPHILRLPFYEQAGWPAGIDATYFQPNDPSQKLVDLRFQNDSPWPCLIQLTARRKLITAEIYGGAIDYDVEIDGPVVTGNRLARLVERPAQWLKPGKRKMVQEPRDGINVEFWRIVRSGDRISSERSFASRYRPEHGVVYVGTAHETAETISTG